MRIFSHLFLQFHSNYLWICDICSPNSLKPSFPTYFLQIYCLELIGPMIINGAYTTVKLITLTTKCTFKTKPVEAKIWFSQLVSKTHHFVFCLFSFSNHAISVCSLLFSFFFFLFSFEYLYKLARYCYTNPTNFTI